MTRFARAKGSKSSNERVPENPTPWSIMKEQLLEKQKEAEESKKRQEAVDQRNSNYKAFLKEKQADDLKKTQWAEFPGVTKATDSNKKKKQKKATTNFLNGAIDNEDGSNDEDFAALKSKVDRVLNNMENKTKDDDSDEMPTEQSSKVETPTPVINTKKSKTKKLKIVIDNEEQVNNVSKKLKKDDKKESLKKNNSKSSSSNMETEVAAKSPKALKKEKKNKKDLKAFTGDIPSNGENTVKPSAKLTKQKNKKTVKPTGPDTTSDDGKNTKKLAKNKKKNASPAKKVIKENLTPEELAKIEKKKQKRLKQLEKKKKKKADLKLQREQQQQEEKTVNTENDTQEQQTHVPSKEDNFTARKPQFVNRKPAKVRDNEEHPRRKPFLPHKMFINGKDVEIDYIEGFPVKKEDAKRLKKLKKDMIAKGLPRSEIDIAMKLERRKAEKALAREKKKVCFHCRKSGHNLSECPLLNKDQVAPNAGGDICYKCGSTEHTHFECKVVREQNFNYATCFVCNEQGHIARQCPDNPKGLYPKGGACKVCGDVTHLKKDCPQFQAQQQRQEESFRIGTYGNSNPDTLDDAESSSAPVANRRPNKIIKF